MSKYRPNYALQLSNQLFATVQRAPRTELLDVEIAAEHDIEVELVHRTLDRYVTSGWLTMAVRQRPLSNKPVRLYTVTHDYNERPLLPPDAPLRRPEPVSPAGAKPRNEPKPLSADELAAANVHTIVAGPVAPAPAAPSSEAVPSESTPVEAVKTTKPTPARKAKPAATSKETTMPRGVYDRTDKEKAVPTEHKFSCALFDDDRLLVRAGGKSIELSPEDTAKLAAYLDRIGAFEPMAKAA
jgi:type IV secretory pathway VirB10-like protein